MTAMTKLLRKISIAFLCHFNNIDTNPISAALEWTQNIWRGNSLYKSQSVRRSVLLAIILLLTIERYSIHTESQYPYISNIIEFNNVISQERELILVRNCLWGVQVPL